MADKKTGFEKAAEAQQTSTAAVTSAAATTGNGEKKKHTVRKRDNDLLAMNRIDAILEKFSVHTAARILRYCTDKQLERQAAGDKTVDPGTRTDQPAIPQLG